eukprot:CAMPEP_0204204836 /NCGR_PEP_ID=MMETSP0361-20130328/69914_1 /ASSEMBLY_ACC=CAM_ASM_000343 /TAXON_ID=268821 /ORGANISM="Scrippsiella Hangoei, Strain SHTV-5" /LENGTH=631 /DNA_ID=CAMNT_0051168005 /DNA_START=34 /DNA_END=1929 /DNA_ORIENTATION=+
MVAWNGDDAPGHLEKANDSDTEDVIWHSSDGQFAQAMRTLLESHFLRHERKVKKIVEDAVASLRENLDNKVPRASTAELRHVQPKLCETSSNLAWQIRGASSQPGLDSNAPPTVNKPERSPCPAKTGSCVTGSRRSGSSMVLSSLSGILADPSPQFFQDPEPPPMTHAKRSSNKRRSIKFEDENTQPARTVVGRLWARLESVLDWWSCLEEPPCDSRMYRFVHHWRFESVFATVIAFNTAFAIYNTNYDIEHAGEDPTGFMVTVELALVCFYGIEMACKLAAHGRWFFCKRNMTWNILDLFLVLLSIYEQFIGLLSLNGPGISLSFMRTLRILKIAKVLRVVTILTLFAELRLIMNSLVGSIVSMFWSFVMLTLVFLLFGLVFAQGCGIYLAEHGEWLRSQHPDTHTEMLSSFGSVQLAMLSLLKTSTGGADWSGYFDSLVLAGSWYGACFILFIGFYHIAVINILTGIFVDNAMKLAVLDRDDRALKMKQDDEEFREELLELFSEFDTRGTGMVTVDAFEKHLKAKNGKLQAQLGLLGLPVNGAANFFRVVEVLCRDGRLCNEKEANILSLVDSCMQLKGQASNLHLQCVAGDLLHLAKMIQEQNELCEMLNEKLATGGFAYVDAIGVTL